jgi:hypothetical protein
MWTPTSRGLTSQETKEDGLIPLNSFSDCPLFVGVSHPLDVQNGVKDPGGWMFGNHPRRAAR